MAADNCLNATLRAIKLLGPTPPVPLVAASGRAGAGGGGAGNPPTINSVRTGVRTRFSLLASLLKEGLLHFMAIRI